MQHIMIHNRKIQRWFNACLALFTAASLVVSCSDKDENDNNDEIKPVTSDVTKTYTLSIPATIDGNGSLSKAVSINGTSALGRFESSEKIYVYNVTKSAMVSNSWSNYLQPTDISSDGKSCTLTGSFSGTIEEGDEITLVYNMTQIYSSSPSSCYFDYENQTGEESSILDGGIAKNLIVKSTDNGELTTTSPAEFQLCQSIFRFKFVDGDNNPINVKILKIEGRNIAEYYRPFDAQSTYSITSVSITTSTVTSDYIYVALCFRASVAGDELTFTVKDDQNNEYKGSKSATSGFENGNYYYNSSAIQLEKQAQLIQPTITCGEGSSVNLREQYNNYTVYGPQVSGSYTPSTITISGTSQGYSFYLSRGSTTTLDNYTATYNDDNIIYSAGDLNLILNGTNTFICKSDYAAIFVDGTLKLSGNGSLTITSSNQIGRKGMVGDNYDSNNNGSDVAEADVSSLIAADGYTVTRSAKTTNDDGSCTWTYTVAPSN